MLATTIVCQLTEKICSALVLQICFESPRDVVCGNLYHLHSASFEMEDYKNKKQILTLKSYQITHLRCNVVNFKKQKYTLMSISFLFH